MARRKQCAKCPWKVSTNPEEIPNGYCRLKHQNLESTIAEPGVLSEGPLRMMACHESDEGSELACVGWLANQLGPGNNLALRVHAIQRRELLEFDLVGEQHKTLEDTLGTA